MILTSAAFLADVLARGLEPVVPTKTLAKASIPGPVRKRVIPVALARAHRRNVRAALAAHHVRNRTRPPQLARARTRIERLFAETKESHGLHRATGIGLQMMNIHALLTATVQNLRRLAKTYRTTEAGQARALSASLARAYHLLHSRLAQLVCPSVQRTFSLNF